jgi:hypothetical protein
MTIAPSGPARPSARQVPRQGAAARRLAARRRADRRQGAAQRKVPQIAFKPDWTKHRKAAPFKRNDAMLAVMPIGVIVFPGTGIQANVAWKAAQLGIPVWSFDGGA